MGASHGDFTKYPRTPHLFGSRGTDDDKHLGEAESQVFIADRSLIVEEKIDGTNVGIHFSDSGEMILQCRGHLITEGMHPQYDRFTDYKARLEIVYREPPFPIILAQNRQRERNVPESVLYHLSTKYEPPTWPECHHLEPSDQQ